MSLLSDTEIKVLLEASPSILSGFKQPTDWFADKSLVQPSSLDLHIGEIFIPPKDEPKAGEAVLKLDRYTLLPGQTIKVDTLEKLRLPNNIAAFGFPPTSISDRAILMTNPGHIDPGFEGKLNFTLINMGRDSFSVEKGITIVTLLLMKLAQPVSRGFADRNPDFSQIEHTPSELFLLGRDFLNLDERTRIAAENAVRKEDLSIKNKQIWIPVATAALGGLIAFGAAWLQSSQAIADLKQEVSALKNQLNIETRLKGVEEKITTLSGNSNKQNNGNIPAKKEE